RRRRDEPDAGDRVADPGNNIVDLMAGELAAFAGLGALGHLDLQFVGVDEVVGGDAEAGAGDLLDGAAAAVGGTPLLFTALASVGLGADAVHGDGEGLVRLLRDGAERHGAGGEALDDILGGLDLLDRHGLIGVLQLQKAAEGAELAVLLID